MSRKENIKSISVTIKNLKRTLDKEFYLASNAFSIQNASLIQE